MEIIMWQKILDFIKSIKSLFSKPTPTPTPTPVPTPEPPDDGNEGSTTPNTLHGAVYSTTGCIRINSRQAGFVNNPANSRNTLKVVMPNIYSGKIARVVVFTSDGSFKEELKRMTPNESDNRQRYYGKSNINNYPNNLELRWDCNDNGMVKDYCFLIPDPQQRMG